MAWSNKLQTALFHDNLRALYTEMAGAVYNHPSLIFRMGGQALACPLSQFTALSPRLPLSLRLPPFVAESCSNSVLVLWLPACDPSLKLRLHWPDDTVHSIACRKCWGGGAHWGSFRTVSLATWANKERARGGRETSRKAVHQLAKEHWRSDSRCTITLVFRFGPSA